MPPELALLEGKEPRLTHVNGFEASLSTRWYARSFSTIMYQVVLYIDHNEGAEAMLFQ